nr:hypothetical protein CFP56_69457 [Quercus suber]
MIISIWISAYLLTAIGVWLHGEQYFVNAGSWCWVSSAFQNDRLALHCVWIFLVQSATILTYTVTLISLRSKHQLLAKAAQKHNGGLLTANMRTIAAVKRVAALMLLYPCVYVLLTLPLSAGRMWSMAHHGRPMGETYSCVAGALLTSCGWVDCFLYTVTRSRLLRGTMSDGPDRQSRDDTDLSTLELHGGEIPETAKLSSGPVSPPLPSKPTKPRLETTQVQNSRGRRMYPATTTPRVVRFASRHVVRRAASPTSSIVPILLPSPNMPDDDRYPPPPPSEPVLHFKHPVCKQPVSPSTVPPPTGGSIHYGHGRVTGSWDSGRSSRLSFDEVETALPSFPARTR